MASHPLAALAAVGPRLGLVLAAGLALLVWAVACGDDPTLAADAPEGHTIVRDSAVHAPGFRSPEASCTACHGDDLRGGPEGEPSCVACHGEVW